MAQKPDFADRCRLLHCSVTKRDSCLQDFGERLHLTVTEFLGTSPEVNPGEKYIVVGRYELSGDEPVSLGAVVPGTSRGQYADLAPGSGEFTVWTEVLGIRERGGRRNIGLMVGTAEDRECGDVHTAIRITE